MSTQRKRIVVLAAAIACSGGSILPLTRNHHYLAGAFVGLMAIGLVYVIFELFKLKRAEKRTEFG